MTRMSRRPPASMATSMRAATDSILDQLLHGGGRPLDHLAGGDAIDEKGIETDEHGMKGASE